MTKKGSKSARSEKAGEKASEEQLISGEAENVERRIDDSPLVQIASIVAAGAISIIIFRQLQKRFQEEPFADTALDLAKEIAARTLMQQIEKKDSE